MFEQLAGVVNERASLMLSAWESWHSTQSPVLDLSDDADLFVQSQALDVADLFAVALPTPYPSQRQSPSVRGSAFDEEGEAMGATCSEALLGLGESVVEHNICGEVADFEPLNESEMLSTIKSLSHGENIPQWSEQVSEGMRSLTIKAKHQGQALPLLSLQQSLHMPLVEVWLALLLGDTGYQLTRQVGVEQDDFTA